MRAHKLAVTIPETRRLELVLPDDLLPGDAEVIVLVRERGDLPARVPPGSREAIDAAERVVDAWRAQNADKLLSKEEIEEHIAAERASWDDE